ncbi:MAG: biopolymer transporter ExbD [Puniceicoccales bacterium]|jgi:biopolymer transport protein ExbD|nr:biopolymer transporter ExbD [Puniceicoccales bacterium]
MRRVDTQGGNSDVGFQIAPMIDVVFVILVFFMVLAGQVRVEYELKIKLPGAETDGDQIEIPDELTISVIENGQVAINGNEVDKPTDRNLVNLYAEISRLKQNAKHSQTKLLVTLEAEETANYDRIALVLDTLAAAGAAENVTFAIGDGDY